MTDIIFALFIGLCYGTFVVSSIMLFGISIGWGMVFASRLLR